MEFWGVDKPLKDPNSNAIIRNGEKRLLKLRQRTDIDTNKHVRKEIRNIEKRITIQKELLNNK